MALKTTQTKTGPWEFIICLNWFQLSVPIKQAAECKQASFSLKRTCHHQREVEAFLHRLPVDLVRQSCKAHILFLLEHKEKETEVFSVFMLHFISSYGSCQVCCDICRYLSCKSHHQPRDETQMCFCNVGKILGRFISRENNYCLDKLFICLVM